jgi:hypothetical protein
MNQAIVIGSTTRTKNWLQNCLSSFGKYDKYPIIVVVNDDFELGKLKWAYDNTNLDEIFLLHDTVEIKDTSIFDIAFKDNIGSSFAMANQPVYMGMFMGKYRREILSQMNIPITKTKLEAVMAEMSFNSEYAGKEQRKAIIDNPIHDGNIFEEKFGRTNMILENKYLKKYKGTWTLEMAKQQI